ncbi:MAG: tyrosine-type recombinase/integrase [Gammaproteobacteria bacterium]|nr:tyrosine-type recombinase/integrase [Gammaproteobacteria bacterium]MCW5584152.1 tyrosine-type recombinase/integrase [Gammaproteobacteria bacterium]
MGNPKSIQPLFILTDSPEQMGKAIIRFSSDDYNKELGTALIDANDDAEAISAFLQEYKDSPETLRSYTKEIERLLLWCIHISKVNISSLRRDHLLKYQAFLKKPEPKKIWCGPSVGRLAKDESLNKNWRPFVNGLSDASINKALKILDSFFNYLVQTNYLIGNPLAVDRRRKKRNSTKPRIIDRYLELDEIRATLDALINHPIKDDKIKFQIIRARYIILLLFYTGLRIAEAAQHTMGNFLQREKNWFLRVTGKGKKIREIPIPDELLAALTSFRTSVALPSPLPKFREKTPLIPMQNLNQPISARRIDQILRWAFNLGANQFEPDEPRKASKLRSASAHWLRHSYVTYLLDSGAPLKVAQENAGHSDIGTTMLYHHVAQTDRHAATRALSLANKRKKY